MLSAIGSTRVGTILLHGGLILLALVWLSPMSWLMLTAVDGNASGAFHFPDLFTFDHFESVLTGTSMRQFMNSMMIAVGTATSTMLLAATAAYPFSRMNIPCKNGFLWGLVLLRILPSTAILIPVFISARITGLLNIGGVIIIMTLLNLPFAILLLKNFFDTVPTELEEAAYMEGATLRQNLFHIVMPISRAGLAVVWFMAFTFTWNEFLFPFLMLRSDVDFPMAVGLYSSFGQYGATNYGFLTAYSIIYAIPAIGVYFLLKRNLTTGFAGVGVKG